MDLRALYSSYIHDAGLLLDRLGVREDLVQNDTLCLQVPSNERYNEVLEELVTRGKLLSESQVNGRLIAVVELFEPLAAGGWQVSFVELPQPKKCVGQEGVRHLQFVTRTGIESFRSRFPQLNFHDRGNTVNRLLEIATPAATVRFHDKNMGAVIELEQGS